MKLSHRVCLGVAVTGVLGLWSCKTKKDENPESVVTEEQVEAHKDSGHVMSLVTPGALAKTANGDLQYGPGTKETSWLENDALFLSLPVERFPELSYIATPIREVLVVVRRSDVKGLQNAVQLTGSSRRDNSATHMNRAIDSYARAVSRHTQIDDAAKLRIADAARVPKPGESAADFDSRILSIETRENKTLDVNSADFRADTEAFASATRLYADAVKQDARWKYRAQGGIFTFAFAGLVTALLVTNHMKGGVSELSESQKEVAELRKELDKLRAKQAEGDKKKSTGSDSEFDDWGLGLTGSSVEESFPVREADFGGGVKAYISSYVEKEGAGYIDLTRSIVLTGRHKVIDTEFQSDCNNSCLVSVKK
ncbi:MAG: hypothetical protein AB8C84_03315 [Oligoflexales bacterium]